MTSLDSDRHDEILTLLLAGDPDRGLVERVCELSVDLLGVSGAGLCLVFGSSQKILVHGTDPVAEELEDLQVTLGQGPCVESVRSAAPVIVPELANFRSTSWAPYAERALALGVRAVFTFPLQVDGDQLGALDLYRVAPGLLDIAQLADAAILTSILTRVLIAHREHSDPEDSFNALQVMTTALREPAVQIPARITDLGVSVRQVTALPPRGSPAEPVAAPPGRPPGRHDT